MRSHERGARRAAAIRVAVALAAVLVLSAAYATPSYARRHVPFGLFGAVVDGPLLSASSTQLDSQMGLMARSGVESVRTMLSWADAEPWPGVYNWGPSDRMVLLAARHGLAVLPIVIYSPQWASARPLAKDRHGYAAYFYYGPRRTSYYTDFLRALIARYGPHGSLWRAFPTLARPIREWQIWNEPAADFFWKSRPWATTYTRLLRASHSAVHRADPHARVVLGGLAGLNNATPWGEMSTIYRHGGRGAFDVAAVHPFSDDRRGARQSVNRVLAIVSRVRSEMRRHGDRRKPIWLTELSWTAALHRIPRSQYLGLENTARGQAQRLAAMYSRIARDHPFGIQRAYWYTWSSYYVPRSVDGFATSFQYAGLTRGSISGRSFHVMPLLATYRRTAARYEGCRKTSDARRCRH